MYNQHPAFRKNTLADSLRLWCHLVYLGEIVPPPSVMWRRLDLKRGAKIGWHCLLNVYNRKAFASVNSRHIQCFRNLGENVAILTEICHWFTDNLRLGTDFQVVIFCERDYFSSLNISNCISRYWPVCSCSV